MITWYLHGGFSVSKYGFDWSIMNQWKWQLKFQPYRADNAASIYAQVGPVAAFFSVFRNGVVE